MKYIQNIQGVFKRPRSLPPEVESQVCKSCPERMSQLNALGWYEDIEVGRNTVIPDVHENLTGQAVLNGNIVTYTWSKENKSLNELKLMIREVYEKKIKTYDEEASQDIDNDKLIMQAIYLMLAGATKDTNQRLNDIYIMMGKHVNRKNTLSGIPAAIQGATTHDQLKQIFNQILNL